MLPFSAAVSSRAVSFSIGGARFAPSLAARGGKQQRCRSVFLYRVYAAVYLVFMGSVLGKDVDCIMGLSRE